MKKIYSTLIICLAVVLLAISGFVIWAISACEPQPEALSAMQSDDLVDVKHDRWIVFSPAQHDPMVGFIFYPGAKVDARSYAPPARAIAANGYLVVVVPMPLKLALFGINKAAEVMNAFPSIDYWTIGGHSLGGAMAASYVSKNLSVINGLVLWSSYPAKDNDLSSAIDLLTVSIYETLDGRAITKNIDLLRALLPPHTRWIPIEGGSHDQFGWYGHQKGENIPTISREEQQQMIIEATVNLLAQIEKERAK